MQVMRHSIDFYPGVSGVTGEGMFFWFHRHYLGIPGAMGSLSSVFWGDVMTLLVEVSPGYFLAVIWTTGVKKARRPSRRLQEKVQRWSSFGLTVL